MSSANDSHKITQTPRPLLDKPFAEAQARAALLGIQLRWISDEHGAKTFVAGSGPNTKYFHDIARVLEWIADSEAGHTRELSSLQARLDAFSSGIARTIGTDADVLSQHYAAHLLTVAARLIDLDVSPGLGTPTER
ncbi:hypothetical protein [Ottowia thiooxydans]|uniref:hypothetical protein n=1 Tax=Ottowia thiooxydans TaxID=219182 RepID=UPI000418095D|nr:hypothetical protein [Ottowia thiooxydans]